MTYLYRIDNVCFTPTSEKVKTNLNKCTITYLFRYLKEPPDKHAPEQNKVVTIRYYERLIKKLGQMPKKKTN